MNNNSTNIPNNSYDFIIVGGGVYGVCIAYYLSKQPNIKTLLIEQYKIGHEHGSSHSPTRITRAAYDKELYRDLNLKALAENWKELQKLLDFKFVYPAPYFYFDNQQASYEEFKKVADGTDNFITLSPEDVCKRFTAMPLIKTKFNPIIDMKAGILAAEDFIQLMRKYLIEKCSANLTVLQNTKVEKINENTTGVTITTSTTIFTCKKAILSSGRWITDLAPSTKQYFKPIKQYVCYLQLQDMPKYDLSKFASFYYRQSQQFHYYCLADHKQWGVKFGRHAFHLPQQQDNIQYQQKFLQQKAKQIFGKQFIKINKIQTCYYTFTGSQDFILDYVDPLTEKILVCSCCSGHGFKFAPIIGDIAAQVILGEGKDKNEEQPTLNEVYNKWKHMFKFAYHKGLDLS